MGRRRFAVVLLVPPPFAAEVDVLRRAVGVDDVDRIAPHITLVPPVNVRDEAVDEALALVDHAAAGAEPIGATLGPAATFWPRSPVLFLAVGGDEAVGAMATLRDELFQPPLSRPEGRRFVPHVTLHNRVPEDLIRGGPGLLGGYEVDVRFDRLHLLEQFATDRGRPWRPAHEAPLGAPDVVGRGGVELDLGVTAGLPLDAQALLRRNSADAPVSELAAGRWVAVAEPLVVVARRRSVPDGPPVPVGVLAGWQAGDVLVVDDLLVGEADRRQGIGRQLLRWVEGLAVERGAHQLVAAVPDTEPAVGLFRSTGWDVGALTAGQRAEPRRAAVRRLAP